MVICSFHLFQNQSRERGTGECLGAHMSYPALQEAYRSVPTLLLRPIAFHTSLLRYPPGAL